MNPIMRLLNSLRRNGFWKAMDLLLLDIHNVIVKKYVHYRDWNTSYTLYGTPKKNENLVVVLAGYKDPLWPTTLRRIAKHLDNNMDVCILTAGKSVKAIEEFCKEHDWTYLSTSKNKTGVALNTAIHLHPAAKWIYKLDEDIFIGDNFFSSLKEGYKIIAAEGKYRPGFCAPILNVNGVSYYNFLDKLDIRKNYFDQFKECVISCGDVNIHHNPDAAIWVWKHSLPFDKMVDYFSQQNPTAITIPMRFSIGAILFERTTWEKFGGFKSAFRQGILGVDEEFFCKECLLFSRPMFLIENVFAGHFSFYPQEAGMLKMIPEFQAIDPETFSHSKP